MCPVCLTDRWPSTHTHTSMHVHPHKIRNALMKLHTCIHMHAVTRHLTSHEAHGKSHALSLIHANTCSGSQTHSHMYSWSLTPFTKQSRCTHTGAQPHISFRYRVHTHPNHTHTHRLWAWTPPLTQWKASLWLSMHDVSLCAAWSKTSLATNRWWNNMQQDGVHLSPGKSVVIRKYHKRWINIIASREDFS